MAYQEKKRSLLGKISKCAHQFFCWLKPLSALSPVWCLDVMALVPGTPGTAGCDSAAEAVPNTSTNKSHMHRGAPFFLWCLHRKSGTIKKSDACSPMSNPNASMIYSNNFFKVLKRYLQSHGLACFLVILPPNVTWNTPAHLWWYLQTSQRASIYYWKK